MAKRDLDKPKNKRMTSLVDENLQKESELLQTLIKEVVEANDKVKAAHEEREQKTNERLENLEKDIERLKEEIDNIEQETTLKQLNHLLDSKDRIFNALETMRSHYTDTFLSRDSALKSEGVRQTLLSVIDEYAASIADPAPFFRSFNDTMAAFIEDIFESAEKHFSGYYLEEDRTEELLTTLETNMKSLKQRFDDLLPSLKALLEERGHMLLESSDDTDLKTRIEETASERTIALDEKEKHLKETHEEAIAAIDEQIENIRQDTLEALREKHAKRLEEEKATKTGIEKDLGQLRLDIIRAEKDGEETRMKELLKTYDKKKHALENLFEEKLAKKAEKKTRTEREKLYKKRLKEEMNYTKAAYDLRYERERENIRLSDSEELFKLKEDEAALAKDFTFNRQFIDALEEKLDDFETFQNEVMLFIESFHKLLLENEATFLNTAIKQTEKLSELKRDLKEAQLKLSKHFKLRYLEQRRSKARLEHAIKEIAENIRHHQALSKVDKHLIDSDKQASIERLNAEEQLQKERIEQESLIELADKEYELQLLKIKSLYDNEMDLTKAQSSRLEIGQGVNKVMVSTTIESQIHFARQQIKFAEEEYRLRLENIDRSLKKELEYAEEKRDSHRQKYRTDIHNLTQERDRKLEDIEYKLALFTKEKERKELEEKKQRIQETYQERIDAVKEQEKNDPYVLRYQKQIDAAKARAEKAKADAEKLKERTQSTFKRMLEASEEKLGHFEESTDDSGLSPYIEEQAGTTAKKRYEDALEDIKSTYEEKVSKPKERLKSIQKRLDELRGTHEGDKEDIASRREQLLEKHKGILQSERGKLDETLQSIDKEEERFLKQTNDVEASLDDTRPPLNIQPLKRELAKRIEQLKRSQESKRNAQRDTLKKAIDKRRKELRNMRGSLDSHLEKTHKAYKRFVHKATDSQRRRQRKARRRIMREKRKALKKLKERYKESDT